MRTLLLIALLAESFSFSPLLICRPRPDATHAQFLTTNTNKLNQWKPPPIISTRVYAEGGGSELSRYKTRSAILQNTLQTKQSETKLLNQKLEILQSVIKKLQSSNTNLLEKMIHLQQEKEDIHIKDDSEIRPPDMQAQLIKEEFHSKESEWEKALSMAQVKYTKVKEQCSALADKVEEREIDIRFYKERAQVDESEMIVLREEISNKDKLIDELGVEVNELKAKLEETSILRENEDSIANNEYGEKLSLLEVQIETLEKQNSLAKQQMQDMGTKWKQRREELQQVIEEKTSRVQALEDDLSKMQTAKVEIEVEWNKTLHGLEQLQNSTESASVEKEELAQQLSKESLEIATAAVRQAEEREKEIQIASDESLRQLDDSRAENVALKKTITGLEEDMRRVKESKAIELERKEQEMEKQIKTLKIDLQSSNDRYAESMHNLTDLQEEISIERRMFEEKIEAGKMESELQQSRNHTKVGSALPTESPAATNQDDQVQIFPFVPQERKLTRLARRVKSIWRK